jgi:hypothetical protein
MICIKVNKNSIIHKINIWERYQFLLLGEPLNEGDIKCCKFSFNRH